MSLQIRYLSVEDILKQKDEEYKFAQDCATAKEELAVHVKKICSEKAFTIGDLAKYLKNSKIQNILLTFSNSKLKQVLDKIIIKEHGSSYTRQELHRNWHEVRRFVFLFIWRRFYYYDPKGLEKEEQERILNKKW